MESQMKLDAKKLGYRIIEDNIEFYCCMENYPDLQEFESVYISGTFNGWLFTGDSSWLLKKTQEKGKTVFILSKPFSVINVPGNSGFPEFKFFGLSDNSCHILGEKEGAPNIFLTNKLVLTSEKDFEAFEKLKASANVFLKLSDFDLSCPACRAEIANFRPVPGTKNLFRGYHPYKRSRPYMDTENERMRLVEEALELYGINSCITLSGYEVCSEMAGETLPSVIEKIEKKNNRLCVNIDYNLVYFHSDAAEYSSTLSKISKFILEHTGPYYIHCRLGSDRTGVTCGVFASLAGASWDEIAEDYEKTTFCGIGEFRNRKLLAYSIQKMIGKNPALVSDLQGEMKNYFIRESILKPAEIEKLIKKFSVSGRKKETDYFNFSGMHICAKKSIKQ